VRRVEARVQECVGQCDAALVALHAAEAHYWGTHTQLEGLKR
jgi:hypothetical protein